MHTLYQFTEPWIVDDSAFRSTFDVQATPLAVALPATLHWYAERTTSSTAGVAR